MPERIVHAGETVVMALSAVSSLLIVSRPSPPPAGPVYECRGCIALAEDCTRSEQSPDVSAMLTHLDRHVALGHAGAKDALWKLEACGACRGAGTVRNFLSPNSAATNCATCAGSGKNAAGKDRGVRRGVVVD